MMKTVIQHNWLSRVFSESVAIRGGALLGCLAIVALVIWLGLARFGLSLLSQCLALAVILGSLQLLAGRGGIICFGHALYVGAGAYAVAHLMQLSEACGFHLPLAFVPFIGGIAGFLTAIPAGWLSTRRSHAIYIAMVSLALSEFVYALAQVWPAVFGDESGFFIDRTLGNFWGMNFADERLVVFLALGYALISLFILYKITATPLGKWLVAVREDAARVSCLGMHPQRIQYAAFLISGFFAGIGGALLAIEFESVQASMFSVTNSGYYLMFAYLGGLASIVGSIVGAMLQVLGLVWLPSVSAAGELYLGLIFIYAVLNWPGGIAGAIAMCWQKYRICKIHFKQQHHLYLHIGLRLLVRVLMLAGIICSVELLYRTLNHFAQMDVMQRISANKLLLYVAVVSIGLASILSLFFKRPKGRKSDEG